MILVFCSLDNNVIDQLLKNIDFKNTTNNKNYIDQNLFKSQNLLIKHPTYKRNNKCPGKNLDHLFNKNNNLKYVNKKALKIDIFFLRIKNFRLFREHFL